MRKELNREWNRVSEQIHFIPSQEEGQRKLPRSLKRDTRGEQTFPPAASWAPGLGDLSSQITPPQHLPTLLRSGCV